MTDPKDRTPVSPPTAGSWVDEVLTDPTYAPPPSTPAQRPAPPPVAESWEDSEWMDRARAAQTAPYMTPPDPVAAASDGVHLPPVAPPLSDRAVNQKRLTAGLLALFLGSLGVHKFYLGLQNQGLLLVALTFAFPVIAFFLTVMTLGQTVPLLLLSFLVAGLTTLLGVVEGVIYLTKSDQDFAEDYLVGKKPWL